MSYRFHLPPPGPSRARAGLPRLRAVEAVGSSTSLERELAQAGRALGDGRLVRVRRLAAAEARAHAREWARHASPIPTPPGLSAWERRRRDAGAPALAGKPAMRRQRLALAVRGDQGLAVHWSVPEPPTGVQERGWAGLLERLATPDG